jgi:hypothetical protein
LRPTPATALGLGIIVLLAGCVPKYVSPSSGPTAKLRLTTNTEDGTLLSRFDIGACPGKPPSSVVASAGRGTIFDLGEVSPIQMIGTSGAKELLIRERLIEAGQPFVFAVSSSRGAVVGAPGYWCRVSGSFLPEPSGQYEIRYSHIESEHACRARVYRLSLGSDGRAQSTLDPTQRYARVSQDEEYCQSTLTSRERTMAGEEILSAIEATPSMPAAPPSNADTPEVDRPAAAAAAGTSWIRVGDRWKYRLNHGGRGVGTVNVEIREVNGNRATERITLDGFQGFLKERDVETTFIPTRFQTAIVFPGGYQLAEIAPYLPPETELKVGQRWNQIPGEFTIQPIGKRNLLSNAKVVRKEMVRVPAGEFEAWRIESVSDAADYNGNPVWIVCTFWYAPTMTRAVKISVTTNLNYATGTRTENYDLAAFERGK